MKCELCDEYGDPLSFMGIMTVALCPDHRHAFENAGWQWPEADKRFIIRSRERAAISAGNEERAATLASQLLDLEHKLRDRTVQWLVEYKEQVDDDQAKTNSI